MSPETNEAVLPQLRETNGPSTYKEFQE